MIELTNQNTSFQAWYARLTVIARHFNGCCGDVDAWREDYDAGMTPEVSWEEAWDERMPEEL